MGSTTGNQGSSAWLWTLQILRWGSYAGTLYGLGIPVFFESENAKAYLGSAMLCTPIGGLLAYKLSSHRWFEKGETDMICSGGVMGGLYGVAIPYLINIEDLEDWDQGKIYTVSAMFGIPAGVWGTMRLIRSKDISQDRAQLISLGGVLATYYSAGTLYLAGVDEDEHTRAYVSAAALCLPAGAYLAYRFTKDEEYTIGRARLISTGAYAGALLSSGFLRLLMVEGKKPYILATMLGSAIGLRGTHRTTREWGKKVTSAINKYLPDDVTVSLPSYGDLLCFGMASLYKLPLNGDRHMELLTVSF